MALIRASKIIQPGVFCTLVLLCSGYTSPGTISDLTGKCDFITHASKMSCDTRVFTEVPRFSETLQFTELSVLDNKITRLNADDFNNFQHLEKLFLGGNVICMIEKGTFDALFRLMLLDLSSNNLTALKVEMFIGLVSLRELDLSQNTIATIEPGCFEKLTQLVNLELNTNNLAELRKDVFRGLASLKYLDLRFNSITIIQPGAFEGLNALSELDLRGQKLVALESGTFRGLVALKELFLLNNDITVIEPGAFEGLQQLTHISFAENKLSALKRDAFRGLVSLTHLDLSLNKLTTIEYGAFEGLETLRNLDLTYNVIATIEPGVFEGLKALTLLHLNNNKVTDLRNGTFRGLGSLESLDLSYNVITMSETGAFEDLKALTQLSLSNNMLATLKKNMFRGLVSLDSLVFNENFITAIEPDAFEGLEIVTRLYLADNKLAALRMDMFQGLASLQHLNLTSNMITMIEPDTFEGLKALTDLELEKNKLAALSSNTFRGLVSLERLKLSDNLIITIEPGAFDGLKVLTELLLDSNQLTVLSSGTFYGISSVQRHPTDRSIDSGHIGDLNSMNKPVHIDLRLNQLEEIHPLALQGLHQNTTIYTHDWRVCCIVNASDVGCKLIELNATIDWFWGKVYSPNSGYQSLSKSKFEASPFSSCKDLMHNVSLRTFIWIIGIFSVGFNIAAVAWRLLPRCYGSRRNSFPESQKKTTLLAICLAFGDFCMGVFLLIIAVTDHKYRGYYILQDEDWRNSFLCPLAGFLSAFSSEFSVFTLTLITLDRYVVIVSGTRRRSLSYFSVKLIVVGLLLTSALLASIPFMNSGLANFYNQTGVCLALPLSVISTEVPTAVKVSEDDYDIPEDYDYPLSYIATEDSDTMTLDKSKSLTWIYSFSIFTGLNSVSVLIIIFCYVRIFWEAIKSRRRMRSTVNNRESTVGRTILLIVVTDMACWVPVIILGFMSALGHQLSPTIYAWIAVFVLPINSAINPLIYTFYTGASRKAFNKKWSSVRGASSLISPHSRNGSIQEKANESIEMTSYS